MPVTTVIWDWNGTLLNDTELSLAVLNRLLQTHGYAPVPDLARYREIFGFPIRDYYIRAGFDFNKTPFESLAQEYIDGYVPLSLRCPLQSGAAATLAALQSAGAAQVVLSASRSDILQQQLAHFGILPYLHTVLGTDDIYAYSKTQIGAQWISRTGTDKAETLMVGDCVHDYETARAMGVGCVLFDGGHQPAHKLRATGARVIHRLEELIDIVKE